MGREKGSDIRSVVYHVTSTTLLHIGCNLLFTHQLEVEGAGVTVHHTPGHSTDHVVLHLRYSAVLTSVYCVVKSEFSQGRRMQF